MSDRTIEWRCAISADKTSSWLFSEQFLPEQDVGLAARARARELGCYAPSPGSCAILRTVAAALDAHSAVEIGSSAGVAALWLLEGMAPGAVLTSIDAEAEHQRAAKQALEDAGIRGPRTRLISGSPEDVLPRLADSAYDLVLLSGEVTDYPVRVQQAVRLLRPGGVLALASALYRDRVPDPARRDPQTTAVRETTRMIQQSEDLLPAMIPTGDGMLIAVKRQAMR